MNIIDEDSLYKTVTSAARVIFDGGSFNEAEKAQLARWILDRQYRYKGFVFYPSERDRESEIRLFSGEKPRAKFLVDNVVDLETLRLLALIQSENPEVNRIFQEANKRLLPLCFANGCIVGECAHASLAFQRYLLAYDPVASTEKNRQTLQTLRLRRSGDGKWRGFPFFFTLLWLTELPGDMAHSELSYTRSHSEKLAKRLPEEGNNGLIRTKILEKVVI